MAVPRRPGEDDDEVEVESRPRRARDRAQLRAALALEEAGELQEAARMFEYVGEHAQAASLRLEHADTLRDEQQRLAVLREGCARNPANSAQGQALHRALGEALLRVAEGVEPGARRRALALEAAQALEDGQRPGEAGRLYEQLGLLTRAAKAYTEAGDIDRLESVHAILEQREQRQRDLRSLELEVETALTTGRRALAHAMLLEHVRDATREGRTPQASLASALHELERRMIRERAFALVIRERASALVSRERASALTLQRASLPREGGGSGQVADGMNSRESPTIVRFVARPQLRLGRGPQCELTVEGAAISREHVELALAFADGGEPRLVVRDLGSRAGSFLDGEALLPGDDWTLLDEQTSELALGIATSFVLHTRAGPRGDARPLALLRDVKLGPAADRLTTAWTAFAPLGAALWPTPDERLPISIEFDGEQVIARPEPDIHVSLAGRPVGLGEPIELLLHDRVRFEPLRGAAFELEVLPLWP